MRSRNNLFILLALLTLAFPLLANAQGELTGTVTDTEGAPLADARVVLHTQDDNTFAGQAWTDEAGQYLIEDLAEGDYIAVAMRFGFQPQAQDAVIVDGEQTTLDFVLPGQPGGETGSLDGLLEAEDGAPIPDAEVVIYHFPGPPTVVTTDEAGAFFAGEIPVGTATVFSAPAGYIPGEVGVEILEDETATVTLTLEALITGTYAGTVTDAEGAPLEGASVRLVGANGFPGFHLFTGEDGGFEMPLIPTGQYSARAHKFGYMAEEVQVEIFEEQTTTTDFVLTEVGENFSTVSGVVYSADGVEVPQALVTLTRPNFPHPCRVALTDEAGAYMLENVFPGEYILAAQAMGEGMAVLDLEVEAGQELTVDLTLDGQGVDVGAVEGTVQDSDGNPLEGALVTLRHEPFVPGVPLLSINTDEEGFFAFPYVLAGEYTATAFHHGFCREIQAVEVLEGETLELTFVLEEGGGGPWWSDYEPVELTGVAVVETFGPHNHYFIDIDEDGEADARLGFGPPWYEPESGAVRPENGDEITIGGGLLEFEGRMPLVIVFEINGLEWFDPEGNTVNGVAIGGQLPVLAAAEGVLELDEDGLGWLSTGNGGERVPVALGDESYGGENRPSDGDWLSVTGGWYSETAHGEVMVAYTINAETWRTPGDAEGLEILGATSVEEETDALLPEKHLLLSAYPNPFNPVTTLQLSLPRASEVGVVVYDRLGREVQRLQKARMTQGVHQVQLRADGWASGVYYVQVRAAGQTRTMALHLLK